MHSWNICQCLTKLPLLDHLLVLHASTSDCKGSSGKVKHSGIVYPPPPTHTHVHTDPHTHTHTYTYTRTSSSSSSSRVGRWDQKKKKIIIIITISYPSICLHCFLLQTTFPSYSIIVKILSLPKHKYRDDRWTIACSCENGLNPSHANHHSKFAHHSGFILKIPTPAKFVAFRFPYFCFFSFFSVK